MRVDFLFGVIKFPLSSPCFALKPFSISRSIFLYGSQHPQIGLVYFGGSFNRFYFHNINPCRFKMAFKKCREKCSTMYLTSKSSLCYASCLKVFALIYFCLSHSQIGFCFPCLSLSLSLSQSWPTLYSQCKHPVGLSSFLKLRHAALSHFGFRIVCPRNIINQ